MNINKKVFFLFTCVVLIFVSCATSPVNDFFGIKMHPLDEQSFEIISYSVKDGISYKNSVMMDPKLSAWAEINVNSVNIIIQNDTEQKIPLNYNIDEYVLVTDEKSYYLEKGDRIKYSDKLEILPNSSFEISLELPADYWKTSGSPNNYSEQTQLTKDILKGYTKTGTKLNVTKENIKYILIKFGHSATMVLKAVPEKPSIP